MLLTIIIIFSIVLVAIFAGLPILFSRSFITNKNENLGTTKIKIGAIILLAVNAYQLILSIKNATGDFPNFQLVLDNVFSLSIILLYILLGISLLTKLSKLVILSSLELVVFSVFQYIFLRSTAIYYYYIDLLPTVVVLTCLAIALAGASGNTKFFMRFPLLIKIAPFFMLLRLLHMIPQISSITFIQLSVIGISIRVVVFVAFYLIFNAIIPLAKASDTTNEENKTSSKKEKVLLGFTIALFPLIVFLLSSIDKVWLLVALVLGIIIIPIAVFTTIDSPIKTRIIAITCSIAVVVGICVFAKVMPKNEEEFDPYMCHWCDGVGFYITEEGKTRICSHCNGSGER